MTRTTTTTEDQRLALADIVLRAMQDKAGSDTYGVSYALKLNEQRAQKAADEIAALRSASDATRETLEDALEYVESDLRERFSVSGQNLRDQIQERPSFCATADSTCHHPACSCARWDGPPSDTNLQKTQIAPGHDDLMVTPESIGPWLEENPPESSESAPVCQACRRPLAVKSIVGTAGFCSECVSDGFPLAPAHRREAVPVVSIMPMALADGRTDYFVSIKVGDREVTPHVFREEYKAAYHVALYDWLLNGSGEEPDVVEFGPNDWPARAHPHQGGDARKLLVRARQFVADSGCDEDDHDVNLSRDELLADIDRAIAAPVRAAAEPVSDEVVERAWAAIVGSDVAPMCFQASIIRADLKTGIEAALAAPVRDATEPGEMRAALRCAIGHIDHMAAWITEANSDYHVGVYSFESLGEDMPGIRAALSASANEGDGK